MVSSKRQTPRSHYKTLGQEFGHRVAEAWSVNLCYGRINSVVNYKFFFASGAKDKLTLGRMGRLTQTITRRLHLADGEYMSQQSHIISKARTQSIASGSCTCCG